MLTTFETRNQKDIHKEGEEGGNAGQNCLIWHSKRKWLHALIWAIIPENLTKSPSGPRYLLVA
jgi:hypothetical protein